MRLALKGLTCTRAIVLSGNVLRAVRVDPSLMITLWSVIQRMESRTVKWPSSRSSFSFLFVVCGVTLEIGTSTLTLVIY